MEAVVKLNRWELDTLYNLVTSELRTVSDKRRELIKANDEWADNNSLRRDLQRLQLLKTKLDRLRKGHDLQRSSGGVERSNNG